MMDRINNGHYKIILSILPILKILFKTKILILSILPIL